MHLAVLDKIAQQLIFYDIISIISGILEDRVPLLLIQIKSSRGT